MRVSVLVIVGLVCASSALAKKPVRPDDAMTVLLIRSSGPWKSTDVRAALPSTRRYVAAPLLPVDDLAAAVGCASFDAGCAAQIALGIDAQAAHVVDITDGEMTTYTVVADGGRVEHRASWPLSTMPSVITPAEALKAIAAVAVAQLEGTPLPTLLVVAPPDTANVTVDGARAGGGRAVWIGELSEGRHVVAHGPSSESIDLTAGAWFVLPALSAPAVAVSTTAPAAVEGDEPLPWRTIGGAALIGIGVAGLAIGGWQAVTQHLAFTDYADTRTRKGAGGECKVDEPDCLIWINQACTDGQCSTEKFQEYVYGRGAALWVASGGAAAIVGGIVLIATDD
jgi:hypothetical protein